jgi:hypothetical protein
MVVIVVGGEVDEINYSRDFLRNLNLFGTFVLAALGM